MSRSIWIGLLKLTIVFATVFLVFTIFPILPDKDKLTLSIEKEEQIGDFMVNKLLKNDPEFIQINNVRFDSALNIITDRLVKSLDPTGFTYKFILIDNEMVNAFALPGGYIFITTSLVDLTDSPEELAAVIAHEMGHIEKRHVIKKLVKEIGISVLTSNDAVVLGEVGKTAASATFDRRNEKEADEFSLNLLAKSKIDPRVMATFFRQLNEDKLSYDERLQIVMTHPHNNARIKAALEFKIAPDFKSEKIDLNWEEVKELVKSAE